MSLCCAQTVASAAASAGKKGGKAPAPAAKKAAEVKDTITQAAVETAICHWDKSNIRDTPSLVTAIVRPGVCE